MLGISISASGEAAILIKVMSISLQYGSTISNIMYSGNTIEAFTCNDGN